MKKFLSFVVGLGMMTSGCGMMGFAGNSATNPPVTNPPASGSGSSSNSTPAVVYYKKGDRLEVAKDSAVEVNADLYIPFAAPAPEKVGMSGGKVAAIAAGATGVGAALTFAVMYFLNSDASGK